MIKITSLRRIVVNNAYGTEVLYTSDGQFMSARFSYSMTSHDEARRAIEKLRAQLDVKKCIS